ncbi:MAG: shikimate kinase [Peptococcaceae bacterium]|jgi:shikimate kinase|nr:shikimate kinase [Peptococcaceae bacterium]
MPSASNIILIGFMGSGKTTVGKALAKHLSWDFVDTDVEIEKVTELSIAEIFRRYGEIRFRSEECLLIDKIRSCQGCVIATGGGTVLNPENRQKLSAIGLMIHLQVTLEEASARITQKSTRPLLKGSREELEDIWRSRQPVYEEADVTVDTTNKDIETITQEILLFLEKGDKESSVCVTED